MLSVVFELCQTGQTLENLDLFFAKTDSKQLRYARHWRTNYWWALILRTSVISLVTVVDIFSFGEHRLDLEKILNVTKITMIL